MLPKTFRVVRLRGHQLRFRTKLQTAGMKQPRHHAGARTMRASDANRRLGFSITFHAKALYNDDPLRASRRLLCPCPHCKMYIAEKVVHIYVARRCKEMMAVSQMRFVRSISS